MEEKKDFELGEMKNEDVVVEVSQEKNEINKDMTLADIIEKKPEAVEKLLMMGLGCVGCHFSQYETLEEGALAHGMDPDEVLKDLLEEY